jgi:hypothetical protein
MSSGELARTEAATWLAADLASETAAFWARASLLVAAAIVTAWLF